MIAGHDRAICNGWLMAADVALEAPIGEPVVLMAATLQANESIEPLFTLQEFSALFLGRQSLLELIQR